jgi:uncharacterized protein (TIGR02147 family)
MTKPVLPNIYAYNNFRTYLADYQVARQRMEPAFSKSEFSRRLNLPNTRSYFMDIIKGKKVTQTFVDRFISVMELDKSEAQYFRVLVMFNQAEKAEEIELYFGQLISLNRTPKTILDKDLLVYYKNWYNSVIRAILNIYDFSDDYPALGRKVIPAISAKEAKESVLLLARLRLISKDEKGFWRPTDKSISTPDFVKDEMVKQFQIQCLELARVGLIRRSDVRQVVATNIISISGTGYERLAKLIHDFRSQVRSLVHKDDSPADRVYQLSVVLMPFSRQETI